MKKFLTSFRFALRGWVFVWKEEPNFRYQLTGGFLTLGLGYYFDVRPVEWAVLLICIALVLSLELVNTAIERLVDLVTLDRRPLAGKVKDLAAGAVLLASIASVFIGSIIFWPYIFPPR